MPRLSMSRADNGVAIAWDNICDPRLFTGIVAWSEVKDIVATLRTIAEHVIHQCGSNAR